MAAALAKVAPPATCEDDLCPGTVCGGIAGALNPSAREGPRSPEAARAGGWKQPQLSCDRQQDLGGGVGQPAMLGEQESLGPSARGQVTLSCHTPALLTDCLQPFGVHFDVPGAAGHAGRVLQALRRTQPLLGWGQGPGAAA